MKSPRIILAIEMSNPSAESPGSLPGVAVALQDDDQTKLLSRADADPSRPQDELLMVLVDRAMTAAGLIPSDLRSGLVAVSAGPGGYTAVRLAITAAKLIAEATGAACVAVPTSDCVAHRAAPRSPFAVALASKGATAFVTAYDARVRPRAPGVIIDASQLAGLDIARLIADKFLPDSFRAAAAQAKIGIEAPVFDALACAQIAHRYAPVDPVDLSPIYPREPEAVTKWRALKGKSTS